MSLARIIVPLVLIGFGVWGVYTYAPLSPNVKAVINTVLVAVLCIWLLQVLGILGSLKRISGRGGERQSSARDS